MSIIGKDIEVSKIKIKGNKIELNNIDISNMVRAYHINNRVGDVQTVTLELISMDLEFEKETIVLKNNPLSEYDAETLIEEIANRMIAKMKIIPSTCGGCKK